MLSFMCLEQAMDSKCIVNIQNSEEDPRVSRKYDTYDFLNMQWDTGTVGMLSPICERYGDGKLSVRSALHSAHTQGPGIRLDWKNAVVVPMLDRHGAVTGLVLAINKPAYKGWFTKEDEYFVKTLSMMAGLEDILKNTQGDLNNAVSLRRNFIKDAADCIYRSSQNITSTKAFVDDALTSILRATKAHYGAVYLIHPRAEGQATKYDSLGSVSNEKRKKSLPWTVMETGSPINLASAR